MMGSTGPMGYCYEKQELVVTALWELVANEQLRPDEGTRTTVASGPDKGANASLKHIGTALEAIMAVFGYGVWPVE